MHQSHHFLFLPKIGHALRDAGRKRSVSDSAKNKIASSEKKQAAPSARNEQEEEEVTRRTKISSPTVEEILLDIQRSKQRLSRSPSRQSESPPGASVAGQLPTITAAQALATAASPRTEARGMYPFSEPSEALASIRDPKGFVEHATVALAQGWEHKIAVGDSIADQAVAALSPPEGSSSMESASTTRATVSTPTEVGGAVRVDQQEPVIEQQESVAGLEEGKSGAEHGVNMDPIVAEACWELLHGSSGSQETGDS